MDIEKTEKIYVEALKRESEAERRAYLDKACGGDSGIRARVEALLRAGDEACDFLKVSPSFQGPPVDWSISEGPGTVVGRYKLLERIGEGGMAVVYMAEQAEPIRRKVALKIIKLGMDTKSVIARFEAERQALAMMDHPNIAKVLDAGATETGRPYFVMELVQGVSITDYCDKNELNTRDRLTLFAQVCNAVQHAHQKGIIHRDIKPSNVMVTRRDGTPVPKIIDFGIAKATSQKLTEKTLFTRYAHIVGTPAYMSPEQAELSELDVDTRTDIYSLGVLLYELLTGTQPFSEEELRRSGYLEMQRVIREEEPAKPSTKLSTLGPALTDIAKYRKSTPDLLTKTVRGDLDWIVMKSLEKDRARRYETANGLAMDILRHLEHEPVLARGPSATYRLQKFLQRNRVAVVAALALVVVVAVVGIILSEWRKDRLKLAEDESFRHRNVLSQAQESYAKGQLAEALREVGSLLDSEAVGSEAQLLYANILVEGREPNEATAMLEELLHERPGIAGAAHALLARILWESPSTDADKLKKVDEHRQRAEELSPETAEAYFLRAMTALAIKDKLDLLDDALRFDPSHYESRRLRAYIYQASRKYEELEHDALAMTVSRPQYPLGYSLRAIAWHQLGQYEKAIEEYDSAIRFTAKEDPPYVDLNAQRCDSLMAMGQYERVIADARRCLKLVADAMPLEFRIFCALTALGNYEEAASLFERVAESDSEVKGKFTDWSRKYVFDRLVAGQPWHPAESEPEGVAFIPMLWAQWDFSKVSAKARRVVTDAFTGQWSPDGTKLAFSTGFFGYSGVAVWDAETGQTDLLIVPGKDPEWSSNGRRLAFVRDCQALPVSELAGAEREDRLRAFEDEEVWIMRADGTEPGRLASGGWPRWSRDPNEIYFYSVNDGAICKMSIEGTNAKPQKVRECSDLLPEISPDGNYVACRERNSVKILELASGSLFAELRFPSLIDWGKTWSSDSRELCLHVGSFDDIPSGLWVYDMDKGRTSRVLKGPVYPRSVALDGSKLTFNLPSPYFEIWAADLDPNAGIVGSLGSDLVLEEHYQEKLASYTQRIEANPEDANNYFLRAQFYDRWGERSLANADMRRWSAVAGGWEPSDLLFGGRGDFGRVLGLPFDCQLVFSAERPLNTIPMMSVAFGQKGRCKMKLSKVPMFVASLFGLGLLSYLDTPAVRADYVFGTPTVIYPDFVTAPSISTDGLSIYFDASDGYGGWEIWVSTRETVHDDWPAATKPTPPNSSYTDANPDISYDGLTLFFNSTRPGGSGDHDIWVSTRATINDPWGEPNNLGSILNSPDYDGQPCISRDGLSLYFTSQRPGGSGERDTYVSTRATKNDDWSEPQNLGPKVNSPSLDFGPDTSSDGLTLFFSSKRPGGYGGADIWVTRRTTVGAAWSEAVNIGPPVNTSYNDYTPCISEDGSILYFYSNNRLRQAPIIPQVDLNGDGEVNHLDLGMLMLGWGTNSSLYDIGPTPLGDGIVDSKDLMVLAEHGAMLCGDVNFDGVVDLFDLAELSKNWLQNSAQ